MSDTQPTNLAKIKMLEAEVKAWKRKYEQIKNSGNEVVEGTSINEIYEIYHSLSGSARIKFFRENKEILLNR